MFEFNIYNVLNGLEDLSTQEKIKALDEAYEELEAAMNELLLTEEEIEEQYKQEILEKLNEAVVKYVEEKDIQKAIKIKDGTIECNYKDFGVRISPYVYIGDWCLTIDLTRTVRLWLLEEIAEIINAHYDRNMGTCTIPVEEDELIPKTLDIIFKLMFKQS